MKYSLNGKKPLVYSTNYIAPGAKLIGDIELEENVSIWFNAVLRADNEQIKIGRNSNIQDGAIIHVDAGFPVIVGEDVTVGHNVTLHGCKVKDGALIGMGSTILNGAIIGDGALVAAGALLPENTIVEPYTLVAGVPAKSVRKLSDEEIREIKKGSQEYVKNGKKYTELEIIQEK